VSGREHAAEGATDERRDPQVNWLYIVVAVLLAQAAGILQVLYRRRTARLPARLFFLFEGLAFGGAFVLVGLAATGDLYFSLALGLILTTLIIVALVIVIWRGIRKNDYVV